VTCKPGTFSKGDPRINKAGNLNKQAQAWSILFRNHLASKLLPEKAADVLIRAYQRGQAWAIDEVNSRLMGKVTQPIEAEQNITYRVIYEKPKDKDKANAAG
jgi:hypothetical protein